MYTPPVEEDDYDVIIQHPDGSFTTYCARCQSVRKCKNISWQPDHEELVCEECRKELGLSY